MRLVNVALDADEEPAEITVVLTVDEAALMYALTGHVAPLAITTAAGDVKWGEALSDIADCLSGSFFNRYWEDGARGVAPNIRPTFGVDE